MLEVLFCALFTIFPDYLYRRYVQGKRIGREINIYTVWHELRWGITSCLIVTISLITMIFYFHPSTQSVTALFRTVSILPETSGRVAEVYVNLNDEVAVGTPLFRLDSTEQQAALETARRRVDEIAAEMAVAQTELAAADGLIQQAQGSYQTALDELKTKQELQKRSPGTVAVRLATEDLGTPTRVFLHVVDGVGMVHAIILRLQALLLPVQTLVLGGGH